MIPRHRAALAEAAVCLALAAVAAAADDGLAGGDTTVVDATRGAYALPARNLRPEHRPAFFVGNSFFNENWIAAPASVATRDGLGPLFNARSCSACHFKDGRSRPPEPGQPMSTMLLRISVPGAGPHGGPRPHPVYGDQIQGAAIPQVGPEADVLVAYDEVAGAFADGTPYSLRRPSYQIRSPRYGALPRDLLLSPRVAPAMIGLGLLEAVPETTLRALADPDDRDGDGVSGRPNLVWDLRAQRTALGRFGWKAEQPSVLQQAAAAFAGDIGITSSLFPDENHTAAERECARQPSGGRPEIGDELLAKVALYARTLAVPARRGADDPQVRAGEALFRRARCDACHRPRLETGDMPELPELAHQSIQPFTDLLLHDMGEGLADGRPAFAASGREWRTPPLWGLGLLEKVSGHGLLLHDGRARGPAEAVLWHDGEAAAARRAFVAMTAAERAALLAFLGSL
jgi:CxxC motif-containing protein (DUF1111 family)